MEANFSGFVIDPAKCSQLSVEEKRELVHEISIWADNAPEILASWSRRELLQIICAEMGKERKYTGLTKPRMIARLLKLMAERNGNKSRDKLLGDLEMPSSNHSICKRKRKKEQLQLLPASDNVEQWSIAERVDDGLLCQNLACRGSLDRGDAFCRRCSCCICYGYDDNKDPSLWLVCNSDPPYTSQSCGISCHLSCILKHEKSGITKNGSQAKLDGAYFCIACGKVNDLLGIWRKQLIFANEARRVDVLCERITLSHKILKDTEKYKELHSFVNAAMKKLEQEVGPLDKVSFKLARGIVKRLACVAEIQKLCSLALEAADSLLSGLSKPLAVNILDSENKKNGSVRYSEISQNLNNKITAKCEQPNSLRVLDKISSSWINSCVCLIKFKNISPVSVSVLLDFPEQITGEQHIVGAKVWHRVCGSSFYPMEPSCMMHWPDKSAIISGLNPSTEYLFKVLLLSGTKEFGMQETRWITQNSHNLNCIPDAHHRQECDLPPPSQEKEEQEGLMMHHHPMLLQSESQRGSMNSNDDQQTRKPTGTTTWKNPSEIRRLDDFSHDNERHMAPPSSDDMPFVCSNSDPLETPSKSAGLNNGTPDASNKKESAECEYEYSVKVVRWLECEGYMEKDFRVKFLTWFSLKATMQERRVVKAFIDVLIDEPESLVDQLIDAFMDGICSKVKPSQPNAFCTRLWH